MIYVIFHHMILWLYVFLRYPEFVTSLILCWIYDIYVFFDRIANVKDYIHSVWVSLVAIYYVIQSI